MPSSANDDLSKPLPYIGSPAERYRAAEGRRGYEDRGWPKYQPTVLKVSIGIFLIYFCILREENDVDQRMDVKPFGLDIPPDMELVQLKKMYIYNQQNNLSNEGIENRLKELNVPLLRMLNP